MRNPATGSFTFAPAGLASVREPRSSFVGASEATTKPVPPAGMVTFEPACTPTWSPRAGSAPNAPTVTDRDDGSVSVAGTACGRPKTMSPARLQTGGRARPAERVDAPVMDQEAARLARPGAL